MDKSDLKSTGGPGHGREYCEIYFQEFDQIPTVNIREKAPPTSSEGEKKCATALCCSQPGLPEGAGERGEGWGAVLVNQNLTN